MTVYTLFGQAGGATINASTSQFTFGIQFTASASCTATAIWWNSAATAAILPDTIAIYQVTGTSLVHSEAASWSGAAGSGWVRAAFTSPPSLTASTAYKACVRGGDGTHTWWASTVSYWSTGAGSAGITSGILTAPNSATAASPGQDTFISGASLAYPNGVTSASNYWVDIEATTTGSGKRHPSSPVPAISVAVTR